MIIFVRNLFKRVMRKIIYTIFVLMCTLVVRAQYAVSHVKSVRTPVMVVNDNWLAPAVIELGGNDVIHFSFDEMSHVYHRYVCRITHHNADGEKSDLSEIDYLDGFNEFVIDDWENSHNTTQLYTHYAFDLPNEDVAFKVSGNYRVEVFDDEDDSDFPVLTYSFSVVEPMADIQASVSGDTDRSYNEGEQQLSFKVNFARCNISSPANELISVVYKNRRCDDSVMAVQPTYITGNEAEYIHNKSLIFEAGNEYRRFELTDPDSPGMNVEDVIFHDSAYHALLYVDKPRVSYSNFIDENGRFYVNTLEGYGTPIEADYINVHFAIEMPYRSGGDYYISGDFCGNGYAEGNRLLYDANEGYYYTSHLLKTGVYNYQYVWLPYGAEEASVEFTEGNFYNTENEYLIYMYYREFGARYDRLVGFLVVNN